MRAGPFTLYASLPPLDGANRRAHRAELGGLAARVLEGGARVGIDEVALGDLGVGPLDQQTRMLAFEQRPGASASPEVDALARVLGDLLVDDDVGELQPAAAAQDPVALAEHAVLFGHQVDHAVG